MKDTAKENERLEGWSLPPNALDIEREGESGNRRASEDSLDSRRSLWQRFEVHGEEWIG